MRPGLGATRHRNASQVVMPRTPPIGLQSAVSRAMAMPAATAGGTCASRVAAYANKSCASRFSFFL